MEEFWLQRASDCGVNDQSFSSEKFGTNTSAGFSEEPGIREGISLTGPQAAAEQALK